MQWEYRELDQFWHVKKVIIIIIIIIIIVSEAMASLGLTSYVSASLPRNKEKQITLMISCTKNKIKWLEYWE